MDNAVIVWLIVFAVAALIFFGVAAVVTVKGFGDLLALLRDSDVRGNGVKNGRESGNED